MVGSLAGAAGHYWSVMNGGSFLENAAPMPLTIAHRLDWASLLRRVFGEAVTRCPRCGDHLRVLAFLTNPDVTARILDHLGLAKAVPPISPARAPPDDDETLELDLGS